MEVAYEAWRLRDPRLADVMLVLGWTGLRWAEARELRVADFVEVPTPALLVRRSAPEGVGVKATKSGRSRRVPVANRVLPIIKRFTLGKGPNDLLLTTYMGAQLHRNAVVRTLDWKNTARGRRIHDLRHTAACLWLARGAGKAQCGPGVRRGSASERRRNGPRHERTPHDRICSSWSARFLAGGPGQFRGKTIRGGARLEKKPSSPAHHP